MSKKDHFTQTQLASKFALSTIQMGKKLVELQLKNENTKLPSDLAIEKGFAIIVESPTYGKMGVWKSPVFSFLKQHLQIDMQKTYVFNLSKIFNDIVKIAKQYEKETIHHKVAEFLYDDFLEAFNKKFKSLNRDTPQLEWFCQDIIDKKTEKYLSLLSAEDEILIKNTIEKIKLSKKVLPVEEKTSTLL